MSSIISEKIEPLFDAVIHLSTGERERFLRTHCGANPEIRKELESLLAASDLAEDFFSTLEKKLGLQSVFDGDIELPKNKIIGAYRLLELIARGGMGAVYLAERADQQFEKKVALKILPIGSGGENALNNFFTERQILARLQHSNIARLLDAGIADHDTPYFVMDYVDGVTIDEYCTLHTLDIHQRIKLFLQAAEAIEYAHGNLIVHRDIKPGNVLVNQEGEVQLVDFGIAKLLEPNAESQPITRAGERPITLVYSSPETLRGETVTTAMDVYSLGILLYKLLTGNLPFSTSSDNYIDVYAKILEQQPILPSKSILENNSDTSRAIADSCNTSIKSLSQSLSGDLDAIINKTLRKSSKNRYRSVEQLIADLNRYQAKLPISARAPTFTYKIKKLIRRKTAIFVSGTIVFALLFAIALLATQFAIDTKAQSELIAKERDTAIEIRNFLITIFESSHPDQAKGKVLTAKDLLDIGANKIRNELVDTPKLQAELMITIGDVYFSRTLFEMAKIQYKDALKIYSGIYGELSVQYTSTLQRNAEITEQTGNYEEAISLARQALSLNIEMDDLQGIANAQILIGRLLQRMGQLDDVEKLFQNALDIQRELHPRNQDDIATSLENLGILNYQKHDLKKAKTLQLESLDIRRSLFGEKNQIIIGNLYALGNISRKQFSYQDAISYYQEALKISSRLIPQGSADTVFMYNGLGKVFEDLANYDLAEINFRKSANISAVFYGTNHPNRAFVLSNLGHVLIKKKHFVQSQSILQEALNIAKDKIPEHPMLYGLKVDLGISLVTDKNYDEAEKLILGGYHSYIKTENPSKERIIFMLSTLIDLYTVWGKQKETRKYEVLLLEIKKNE